MESVLKTGELVSLFFFFVKKWGENREQIEIYHLEPEKLSKIFLPLY